MPAAAPTATSTICYAVQAINQTVTAATRMVLVNRNVKVVVGNYTYADGEKHVKVSLCADILIQALRKARPTCAVAFLSTPTDLHVVPELAAYKAKEMYGAGLRWLGTEMFMHIVSRGKWLQPNYLAPAQVRVDPQPFLNLTSHSLSLSPVRVHRGTTVQGTRA